MTRFLCRRGWHQAFALLLGLLCSGPVAARQGEAPAQTPPDEQRIVPEAAPPQQLPTPPPAPAKAPAVMKLILPANGMVWIENLPMTTAGPVRLFQSPPLDPAKAYVYKVKVSWPTQPGRPDFVMEHEVTIKAGQTTTVDFSPVMQAGYQPPTQPVSTQGQVQPPNRAQPPVNRAQPPGRLPARRQTPVRGGY